MKISNIKYQTSKIQIKNKIFLIFSLTLLLVLPLSAFAHETEIPHEEAVPAISPLLLVGLVLVLVICGFILWKFVLYTPKSSLSTQSVLSDKTSPAQEKTVSKSSESKISSQSK